jgi:type VI secretion system protein
LVALLTKHGKGYLPPVDAIREALDDIKAHQVAVLAGMQVALTSLLARFDPNALEARIGQEKGIGTLLTAKKSRYWDEFTRLYENIAVEAEDDFQRVFGREFGRAYEEQVRKQGKRRT